jgi:cytoskeletal protein CcmA (bactofilin family)
MPVVAHAGASLRLKGEISSSEDLILHGRIEGKVSLPGHMLTIGPGADVSAEIVARTLILGGSVTGNVAATERFEIKSGGRMNGNLVCPNVVMSEGSEFTGGIDMRRKPGSSEVPFEGDRRGKPSTS